MGKSSPPQEHLALGYQEGMLRVSDSRFVIDRIRAFDAEHCIPANYCRLVAAEFDSAQHCWRAILRDELTGEEHSTKAKVIVNGAGIWTDEVNRLLGVESPYKHVFSKGVYVSFPRDAQQSDAHVYPMQSEDDVLTYVPWGPVMMWGPTETTVRDLESGLAPNRDDIRFLLTSANQSLPRKVGPEDVVSMRCGIRPLAVPRNDARDVYPLELSRRHRVVANQERQTIALYGGKLTSSLQVANRVAKALERWISPRFPLPSADAAFPERLRHAELGYDFVTAEWARDHEFCVTLEDYLRRRTNIAQWKPRMGLGNEDSERERLRNLAAAFTPGPVEADAMAAAYEQQVRTTYDPLLAV